MNYRLLCRKFKIKFKEFHNSFFPIAVYNFKKYKKNAMAKYSGKNDITILSTNCIAGEIYNILGLRFNSPTINTSFDRKDFLIFCENLEKYLEVELEFFGYKKNSTPIMILRHPELPDIKIGFPHDFDIDIIKSNWEKRKKRINFDNIYILSDDREIGIDELERYNKLKFKKVLVFTSKNIDLECCYFVEKYKNSEYVGFYQKRNFDGLYEFQKFFDYVKWLDE